MSAYDQSRAAGTPATSSHSIAANLTHLHPDHIHLGDIGVFAGDWAWEDRGQDRPSRIPVGFVGTLIDYWNGWAVFRCDRQVAEAIVAEQERERTVERRRLEDAGLKDENLAASLDEAYPPMYWAGDEIVVDQRVTYGEEDGVSRVAPDEQGRYVVNGWRWTWTKVDPADCDRVAGEPPTALEQPALVMLPHSGLRVPHTRLVVAAIARPHVGPDAALTAVLRLDGDLVGVADTDGSRPLRFHPAGGGDFDRMRMAVFVASCRRRGQSVTVDEVLRCLAQEYDLTQRAHRSAGLGGTLVRLIDGSGDTLETYGVSAPSDPSGRLLLATRFATTDAHPSGIAWEIWTGQGWAFLTRPAGR